MGGVAGQRATLGLPIGRFVFMPFSSAQIWPRLRALQLCNADQAGGAPTLPYDSVGTGLDWNVIVVPGHALCSTWRLSIAVSWTGANLWKQVCALPRY